MVVVVVERGLGAMTVPMTMVMVVYRNSQKNRADDPVINPPFGPFPLGRSQQGLLAEMRQDPYPTLPFSTWSEMMLLDEWTCS